MSAVELGIDRQFGAADEKLLMFTQSECYRSGGTLDGCKLKVVKENQECEALRRGWGQHSLCASMQRIIPARMSSSRLSIVARAQRIANPGARGAFPCRQGVFACRRGQLDARNRIRGNKGYW